MKINLVYKSFILCILFVFSTSFTSYSGWYNEIIGIHLSKTFKLKKISFQQCAKYETGSYIILVDKKAILTELNKNNTDSIYVQSLSAGNDTLDINNMDRNVQVNLQQILKKQIERKEAIVIYSESGKNIYKIKKRKYNRKTVHTKRRGGIEYIDVKRDVVIFDLGLWIS